MEIFDVPQLSTMLRLSEKGVRRLLATGKLTGRKVGKSWLVADEALKIFLMESDRESESTVNRQREHHERTLSHA